jgi:hypothetical protein
MQRQLGILAGAGLLLIVVGSACASTSTPGPATKGTSVAELRLTARDITFAEKELRLKAGQPTRLVMLNGGRD